MLDKISIASDHAGYELKSEIKLYIETLNYTVIDHGCVDKKKSVDYPDYAVKVVDDIIKREARHGILVCGTGLGMSIVANRFDGIYAALCNSIEIARLAREHGDANILCLGAEFITSSLAKAIVKEFLETEFSRESRHKKRLNKLDNITALSKETTRTFNKGEILKFAKLAEEWWNESSKLKSLHMINPIRTTYITSKIKEFKKCSLEELSLLDIGCGGGILSESMARIGINVTGIDVCQENIKVAQLHAEKAGLDIKYACTSIEDLQENRKYDIILMMEVIEHVNNLHFFIKKAIELLKIDGMVFISSINRTIKSFLVGIIGAEYILNWLPRGTHSWSKFIKPSEIAKYLLDNNVYLKNITGIKYNLVKREWNLTKDMGINYILCGIIY